MFERSKETPIEKSKQAIALQMELLFHRLILDHNLSPTNEVSLYRGIPRSLNIMLDKDTLPRATKRSPNPAILSQCQIIVHRQSMAQAGPSERVSDKKIEVKNADVGCQNDSILSTGGTISSGYRQIPNLKRLLSSETLGTLPPTSRMGISEQRSPSLTSYVDHSNEIVGMNNDNVCRLTSSAASNNSISDDDNEYSDDDESTSSGESSKSGDESDEVSTDAE